MINSVKILQTAYGSDNIKHIDLSDLAPAMLLEDMPMQIAQSVVILEVLKEQAFEVKIKDTEIDIDNAERTYRNICEEAFDLSNNPSRDEERGQKWQGYSLSTGDVVIIENECWMCDSIGWVRLTASGVRRLVNSVAQRPHGLGWGLRTLIRDKILHVGDIISDTSGMMGFDDDGKWVG